MTNMTSPDHIFDAVSSKLKSPWLFCPPEQKLEKCLGYVTRRSADVRGDQCIFNGPCAQNTGDKERAGELLGHFAAVRGGGNASNVAFLELVKEYLLLTHCGMHSKRAVKCIDSEIETERRARRGESHAREHSDIVSEDSESAHNEPALDNCDASIHVVEKIPEIELEKDGGITVSTSALDSDDSVNQAIHGVSELNIKEGSGGVSLEDEPPCITADAAVDSVSGRVVEKGVIKEFIDLGIVKLHRAGSLRDDSSVYREMHRPLTEREMLMGVVYILRRKKRNDLFKIGWTTLTAAERQRQPNNCYSVGSEVVYHSESHFQAACRAESLCHIILRHQKLMVIECERCGGGHREWFTTSEEEVRRTVNIMEALVKLPGYVLVNGQMKLSPEAYVLIKGMSKFDLVGLRASLESPKPELPRSASTSLSGSEAVQDVSLADIPEQSLRSIEEPDHTPPPSTSAVRTTQRVSLGGKLGKMARGAREILENLSRETSPEMEKTKSGRRVSLDVFKKMAIEKKDAFQIGIETFRSDFAEEFKKYDKGAE